MSIIITHEMFVKRIKEKSPSIKILGTYIGCDNPIECECLDCGNIWFPIPRTLNQGSKCPKCGIRNRATKRTRSKEDVLAELALKNPDVMVLGELGEYESTRSKVEWKCKRCGSVWKSQMRNLLDGNSHCYTCSKKRVRETVLLPNEVFLERISKILPHIQPLEKFDGYYVKLECKCNRHDRLFISTPHSLLTGKCGCPLCYETHGERKLRIILEKYGIELKQQFTFDDCKDEALLKFDGYNKEHNVAFEYHGEQHYRVVDFSGHNYEHAKNQFLKMQKRDQIKRNYCNSHGILLIEIPYYHYDDMEDYLIEKIPWLNKKSCSPHDEKELKIA